MRKHSGGIDWTRTRSLPSKLHCKRARVRGYYFKIVDGPYNGTYLPFNPASVTGQMAFTLWVNDTTLIDSFTQIEEVDLRSNISLEVYPNPATDQLTIEYNLLSATFTDVILLNIYGEHIKILQSSEWQGVGKHAISADLNNLSSGVYLVRFSTSQEVIAKKIVVIK